MSLGGGISGREAPSLSLPYRYVALATAALLLYAVLLPFHGDTLLGFYISPGLLFLVHLVTLGWITTTIFGATMQLVPVALQVQISGARWAALLFYLYLPGLAFLLYGFWEGGSGWLRAGAVLMGIAVTLYLVVMAATVIRAGDVPGHSVEALVGAHAATALVFFLFTVLFGVLLVFNRVYGFLGPIHLPGIAAHAGAGVVGWFTLLTYGVGYKLFGMFTLAEDLIDHRVAWTQLGLSSVGLLVLAGVGFAGGGQWVSAAAVGLIAAGGVIFALQVVSLYRRRRRRVPDVIYPFVLAAVGLWVVSLIAAFAGVVGGVPAEGSLWKAVVWLALFGWIGMMIMGHMYKINTFLSWLHKYSDKVGKEEVPKLDALYEPRVARAGWAVYTAGVVVAAVALGFEESAALTVSLAAVSLGIVLYLVNMALIFTR